MFINGIVASGSTHLRDVAKKTPTSAKVTSREKQLSRWYQNEHVSYAVHMLPFIQQLLAGLATQLKLSFPTRKVAVFNSTRVISASQPQRLARLLIATCLAYIWMVYLGVLCMADGWNKRIHRTDRCDLSLFQLGLDLLEHFLNKHLPIPVDFRLPLPAQTT